MGEIRRDQRIVTEAKNCGTEQRIVGKMGTLGITELWKKLRIVGDNGIVEKQGIVGQDRGLWERRGCGGNNELCEI